MTIPFLYIFIQAVQLYTLVYLIQYCYERAKLLKKIEENPIDEDYLALKRPDHFWKIVIISILSDIYLAKYTFF